MSTACTMNRRTFLRDAACVGAAGAGVLATSKSAKADEAAGVTFADTVAWNAEYDVVVLGMGMAGMAAALLAQGLAPVDACVLAAALHARAARAAAKQSMMSAAVWRR